ncbi:ABC transporter ATP-binding protein [Clostridium tagluense]|uniref:ABC transporter ATP-binding protein n=1 Tax=Clostridium tagluense TaxID=360422 RepID=UPI001CF511C9|nr:ABC transporter ATP-binding protein [Clostridium tagluense]MCB2312707.1 ABC transporter ATP-binding protein [Clostridium tagluense]MCB2317473.1 ABC transporter ATP-binding protein [Clostridium tagluense]MCB2322296.1 ABC transporter ATP-binding protein [Clostridium tagluense]MCB2327300.1 ABC transporter ATP-binding protein [Clostridium tagluense]MCB2331974.1 ABC transporter ATP-binding protein [Clostridium tagluense]
MKEILKVSHIEKYYGTKGMVTKALDRISFIVNAGEFVGIMGPSGSGKTTLLNCISTIDDITGGEIDINGTRIDGMSEHKLEKFRREELGFIFQDLNLLDTLTAYENIALALTIQKKNPKEIAEMVENIADKLAIKDLLNKYPYQMSGGQKQRIACARAIISRPSLLLADEPTGALDSKSAAQFLDSLEYLNQEMQATILMVTHDAFTASYAKRILFIKDGKLFTEIKRGKDSRKEFFDRVIQVITEMGGETNHVF